MGRSPCCEADAGVKKGPWTPEEDEKLKEYIEKHGCGSWRNLPKLAGLNRCGKSCRLRWTNYLRPDIKRGTFSDEEDQLIINLHSKLGNKWSMMAARLPGRTDNEIKNYWNTHLRKKLLSMGIDPVTHRPRTDLNPLASLTNLLASANVDNLVTNPLIINALQLQKLQLLQTLIQAVGLQNLNPLALNSFDFQLPLPNNSVTPLVNEIDYMESDGTRTTSLMTIPANSTPYLVADWPENCMADEGREPVNLSASSSPTSTPLEAWGGLTLDDLVSDDLGWKDILDQISWSEEL